MFTSFLGTGVRRALILSILIDTVIFFVGWPLASIGLIPAFVTTFYSDIIWNSVIQLVIFFVILWYFSKKESTQNIENLKREVEEIKKL